MARLVDFEEVYKVLTDNYHHRTETQHEALKEALSKVPTVDAVEVVRCKDCKHFSKYLSEEKADGVCWHNNVDFEVTCNHFCSWGERKEEVT